MGLTYPESIKTNMHAQFDAWWPEKATGEAEVLTRDRLVAFRARREEAKRVGEVTGELEWNEWKHLQGLGVLGIPTVMGRIRDGKADEYEFRLMSYWTAPVMYLESGWPARPYDAPFTPEQNNAQHWLDWWQANRWQYERSLPSD